jgi:hypothetical protein
MSPNVPSTQNDDEDSNSPPLQISYRLFSPGSSWSGTVTKISTSPRCAHIPDEPQSLALQVVSADGGNNLEFIGSNNDGNPDLEAGAGWACITQSGFRGSYNEGDRSILISVLANDQADFAQCTNGATEAPRGWAGYVNIDLTEIAGADGSNCTQIRLRSTQPSSGTQPPSADACTRMGVNGDSCVHIPGCGKCVSGDGEVICTAVRPGTTRPQLPVTSQRFGLTVNDCDGKWTPGTSAVATEAECNATEGEAECHTKRGCGWCVASSWDSGCAGVDESGVPRVPFTAGDGYTVGDCDRGWQGSRHRGRRAQQRVKR